MTNNQLTENSVTQLLNNVRLARDNAERDDNRVDHSFYYALARALEELQERRKAVIDSEPVRNPVLAYADSYRDMAKQGVESVPIWSVITDLERNIAPLYRHAQPAPVVQMISEESRCGNSPANDTNVVKWLTITLPDTSSKAFWSGAGKTETFHPVTYRRWVKEAIERCFAIARIDVEVK